MAGSGTAGPEVPAMVPRSVLSLPSPDSALLRAGS